MMIKPKNAQSMSKRKRGDDVTKFEEKNRVRFQQTIQEMEFHLGASEKHALSISRKVRILNEELRGNI